MKKEIQLRNKKIKGYYVNRSKYVANMYGYVITKAKYYNVDNAEQNSIQNGMSRKSIISNQSIRKLYKNAIWNGGAKHSAKYGYVSNSDKVTKEWRYNLISWNIIYITKHKAYIVHNKWADKTFVYKDVSKKKRIGKGYENTNFSVNRQKGYIYRKERLLKSREQNEDIYLDNEQEKQSRR